MTQITEHFMWDDVVRSQRAIERVRLYAVAASAAVPAAPASASTTR